MTESLRLMAVLAHPDDESLGFGGTLATYAARGVETYLVTATRGEQGWFGDPDAYPGPAALGKTRTAELLAAASALGVRQVDFLGYADGELDRADPAEATARIVRRLRQLRPQVVVTFGPDGAYGHPDHVAICQLTTAAIVCAADGAYRPTDDLPPHAVTKLYYRVWTAAEAAAYQAVFGDLVMRVEDEERRSASWPDWAVTTWIDAGDVWRTVWQAVSCHRSQLPGYGQLEQLTEEQHRQLWGRDGYLRVFSRVNGGRERESDLFAGLRGGRSASGEHRRAKES